MAETKQHSGETVKMLIELVAAVQGPIKELAQEQNLTIETCVNNIIKDAVMHFLNGKSAAYRGMKNETYR